MPLYSFVHLCRDGREKRLLQAELPSDAAAMRYAGELSTTDASGARLTVFDGERRVAHIPGGSTARHIADMTTAIESARERIEASEALLRRS